MKIVSSPIRFALITLFLVGSFHSAEAQLLTEEVPAGWLRKREDTTSRSFSIFTGNRSGIPISAVRGRAVEISKMRLPYVFGGSSPSDGGMDCSGSIKHLLTSLGVQNVPRTSYQQYEWVKEHSRIKKAKSIQHGDLKPGDLIFWGGTYKSGHKVSHVMLYMGRGVDGKLYMYGARSKSLRGVGGAGVDVHVLRPGQHKNLIGYGRVPGL
ncbi:MAG: NlpC/P60 family protein [Verrucomicrobiales bacterium]|nr:NlpC/P60 family protein [Verrucomicrobiales bacterium]